MTRRALLLAGAAAALVAGSSPFWGPPALRRLPWFGVERVEISGTRLLAPHEVLAASRIRRGESVWGAAEAWERALRAHPAVAGARVTRRLPHTLRVRIEEKRPVAYVEAGTLRPATAAGEILPVDPSRAPVDLPIVRGADARVRRALLAETERLGQLDPGLLAGVSEVRRGEGGGVVLVTAHPAAEVLLPAGAEAGRLVQLRAVLGDLERRLAAPEGAEAAPPAGVRVDLRYREQIVVRLSSSVRQS